MISHQLATRKSNLIYVALRKLSIFWNYHAITSMGENKTVGIRKDIYPESLYS